jgi:hypothetical protein
MGEGDAGHRLEQFAGQMQRGADAGRGNRELAWIGLGIGDELAEAMRRQVVGLMRVQSAQRR